MWYVFGVHGILMDQSILLFLGRLLGAQCDLRFNRLTQGAVELADSLGICCCILGPSAQGESRIRCCPAVCYLFIFDGCGGGVFDLSLRRGWFCVVVLFAVIIVIEEYYFVTGAGRAVVVAVAGVLGGPCCRCSKASGSIT